MGQADVNVWARRFVEDLSAAGARILFERVVARHLEELGRLRELGLSWPTISGALIQAGARRTDGTAISTDQLRAAYSRLMKRNGQDADSRPKRRPVRSARPDKSTDQPQPRARAVVAPFEPGKRAGTIRETMQRARELRKDRSEG